MGKQSHQNRVAKRNNGDVLLEQNLAIDDSLLPSATELEQLKNVDPQIIQWILTRTEIEQDARIEFNKERVKLTGYDLKKIHRFNFTSLFLGFFIFIIILGLSAFFVIKGFPVQGTIFGGTAIIGGALFFVKASRTKQK